MDEYLEMVVGAVKTSRLHEEDMMFASRIPPYYSALSIHQSNESSQGITNNDRG